jgi:hypothetical protein
MAGAAQCPSPLGSNTRSRDPATSVPEVRGRAAANSSTLSLVNSAASNINCPSGPPGPPECRCVTIARICAVPNVRRPVRHLVDLIVGQPLSGNSATLVTTTREDSTSWLGECKARIFGVTALEPRLLRGLSPSKWSSRPSGRSLARSTGRLRTARCRDRLSDLT